MAIQITKTDQIVDLDGVACRLWHGVTAGGVPCEVFVHRVAVREDHDSAAFEAELSEQTPAKTWPARGPRAFELRHVI